MLSFVVETQQMVVAVRTMLARLFELSEEAVCSERAARSGGLLALRHRDRTFSSFPVTSTFCSRLLNLESRHPYCKLN